MPPYTISCVAYTVQGDYSATWRFHCYPVIVCSTDMVCSSYIVKHLLKPPLQGVCLSPFACVWHLHDHYCRPSIWIEPTAHWRFTTSYEKAQWLDICLCGSAGQRDEPRGQISPQVDFRELEQQLAQFGVCTGQSKTSEKRSSSLSDTAGSQRDTLPSKTPLQGQ